MKNYSLDTFELNDEAFRYFRCCAESCVDWCGKIPANYAKSIDPSYNSTNLPSLHLTRSSVLDFCRNETSSSEDIFWVCAAWGEMKHPNAQRSWSQRTELVQLIEKIRKKELCRSEMFDIANNAMIDGLGPAFFTKIMFFSSIERNSYILDQWTAKSIQLMFNRIFIIMDSDYVSRRNNGKIYEVYCMLIELVSASLSRMDVHIPPHEVESMMFAGTGVNNKWRKYTKERWCVIKRKIM